MRLPGHPNCHRIDLDQEWAEMRAILIYVNVTYPKGAHAAESCPITQERFG